TALLAHELGHIKLYSIDNGDYHTTSRIVTAIANDSSSEGVFLETGRYYRLYTEIFCDRCALLVTGSETTTQSSLIKIHTGLQQVSAANYLQQAKEILLTGNTASNGDSHPENFIRVLAVHLYHTTPDVADAETATLIEHRFDMNALDIFRQKELAAHTRYLLAQFTNPQWVQSDTILALCKQYFSDFSTTTGGQSFDWKAALFNTNVKEYLAYVLLDLALADPALENVPLGRAFEMAESLDLKTEFAGVVKKEKKLSDKRLRELQAEAVKAAAQVNN
ncbi:MAG TPA: peptidase M48, partial [Chitinophagales bacterium]|nr:peptidase M48 [Chitinophagales bacterium]